MKPKRWAVLLGVWSFLWAAFPQAWGNVHYDHPKWKGYAMDWCRTLEESCGQPAADLFCQKLGFPRSAAFQFEGSVTFSTKTVGGNEVCNPSSRHCDSFAFIECEGNARATPQPTNPPPTNPPPTNPPPRDNTVRSFSYPLYYGYRVDWCLQYKRHCGRPAALAFCRENGFSRVVGFQKQGALRRPTVILGAKTLCQPRLGVCDGFASIQCGR